MRDARDMRMTATKFAPTPLAIMDPLHYTECEIIVGRPYAVVDQTTAEETVSSDKEIQTRDFQMRGPRGLALMQCPARTTA
eukprot:CAMPEP_0172362278 /NCGR_PEP_ID=MMETSP1060-20121228/5924_1 /TAXON_ID=37318 /ORGANISM="Pseudo-nitzschia pungens, Strain cf. cingulata" /LENGTH=80 /DNA_ID=CAMNT_0013084747 /DNA_START=784 /DNA_END=1027 /DNA_ORIENTATION=-